MAHLTNFSFAFFYEIFTEDASLPILYHGAKKSKMTKNPNQGGPALNQPRNTIFSASDATVTLHLSVLITTCSAVSSCLYSQGDKQSCQSDHEQRGRSIHCHRIWRFWRTRTKTHGHWESKSNAKWHEPTACTAETPKKLPVACSPSTPEIAIEFPPTNPLKTVKHGFRLC